jgi:hypothetical protein
MKIEELERLEKAVWDLEGLNYCYTTYPKRNYEYEHFVNQKVLYYLKAGISAKELEKKLERIKKNKLLTK